VRTEIKGKDSEIMVHLSYGYNIVNGKAMIDEKQAETVRKLFDGYIAGLSLKQAAENAGLEIYHGSAGRMLRNTHYLGDEYYPAIIDRERFDKAEEIRISRASSLGRVRELQALQKPIPDTRFTMPSVERKFADPFEQAKYAYSLIESEVAIVE
jgi:hypothetical protein